MADKKNLCAMIPADLHARVRQEQEQSGKTLSEYVEQLIAVRVRTARLRPGHAPDCRARVPDCFLNKYGLQRS